MVAGCLVRLLTEKARQLEEGTFESYERLIRVHITTRFGRVQFAKLNSLLIQTMMSDIADTVGTRTANAGRALLFSANRQAVRWRFVLRTVVEAVYPFKNATKEPDLWMKEEVSSFLKASQVHRLYAALYLELSIGLRRGELLIRIFSED